MSSLLKQRNLGSSVGMDPSLPFLPVLVELSLQLTMVVVSFIIIPSIYEDLMFIISTLTRSDSIV